jgi:serine/threonine-protein kinase
VALEAGHVVAGKYRLVRELGSGGMGAVFEAVHIATLRPFAVKLLRPELAGEREAEARFFREATLASSIQHPAIVEVYDVGRDGDTPYMVMKLLSGQTLRQRIKQGAIRPEAALELLLPVIEGVAAAHTAGVVHRDLKPDNVVLHEHGGTVSPKVLDFGISKLLGVEQREKLTKTGISLGTPLYMSPEQMRGESDLDGRVDVYSLGVILYQMLTGALPYYGKTYADLVISVMSGGAKPVRALNPAVAPALEAAVMRAIATDRAQRCASVAELLTALQQVRGAAETSDTARNLSLPMRDTSTPFTVEARATWSEGSRSRRKLWLSVAGALLLVAGAIGALWPASSPRAGEPHVVTAAAPPARVDEPTVLAAAPPERVAAPVPSLPPAEPAAAPAPLPEPSAARAPDSDLAPRAAPPPTEQIQDPSRPSHRSAGHSKTPREPRAAPAQRRQSELLDPF